MGSLENLPDSKSGAYRAFGNTVNVAVRVRDFSLIRASGERLTRQAPRMLLDHGFRTLVLNRTHRGEYSLYGRGITRNMPLQLPCDHLCLS